MKSQKVKFVLVCISISIFCLIFSGVSYAKVDMKSCIGAWLFDEDKGDTAKDSSEAGNDAKVGNGIKWAAGKYGNALDLDGNADDVLDIPDNDNLNGFSDITMMSWLYIRREVTSGTWNAIFGKNPYTNGYLIWLQIPRNPCGLVYAGGARFDASTGASLDLKRWYHLAFTRDAKGVMKFYIDGALATTANSTAGPITTIGGPLAIGGQSPQVLDGMLDEVMIFNTVLAEADMKSIMANGLERANAVSLSGKLVECWGKLKTNK